MMRPGWRTSSNWKASVCNKDVIIALLVNLDIDHAGLKYWVPCPKSIIIVIYIHITISNLDMVILSCFKTKSKDNYRTCINLDMLILSC